MTTRRSRGNGRVLSPEERMMYQMSISPASSVASGLEDWHSCMSGESSPGGGSSPLSSTPPKSIFGGGRGGGGILSSTMWWGASTNSREKTEIKEESEISSATPTPSQTPSPSPSQSPSRRTPVNSPDRSRSTLYKSVAPRPHAMTRLSGAIATGLEWIAYPYVVKTCDQGCTASTVLKPATSSAGDAFAPCVVCVHDYGASSLSLMRLGELLSSERDCRVFLLDLFGFGGSQPPKGLASRLSPEMHIAQLESKISEAGFYREKLILVGHGMGASLCLQLAAAHPDCAAKIILIDPTCLAARIGPESILSLILGFILPIISLILASLAVPFYTVRGALFSMGLSIPNVPSLLKGFLSLASRYPSFGYTRRHAKALRGVPITVCTTRGWFFHSSVAGSEWGIDHANHVRLEGSSPVGAGLELDESVWCAEEWYSDGEDEAREMSLTLREVEAKADALQKLGRYDEVLAYLEQVSECLPSPATRRHVEVLWRLARAYHDVFWWKSDGEERSVRQGLVTKGLATAFCALQTDSGCASAHLWYALLLSKVGEFEGTKAALVNSFEVREHLTRATQINPTSPVSHYHLGMWCFGTASQSSLSRWTKSLVYTEPPSSSYTEALSHFLRAEEVAPGWEHIGNSIGIARCLEGLGRREEALSCIEGVLRLQPRIMGDAELLAEAGLLRESWDWSKHDVSF